MQGVRTAERPDQPRNWVADILEAAVTEPRDRTHSELFEIYLAKVLVLAVGVALAAAPILLLPHLQVLPGGIAAALGLEVAITAACLWIFWRGRGRPKVGA